MSRLWSIRRTHDTLTKLVLHEATHKRRDALPRLNPVKLSLAMERLRDTDVGDNHLLIRRGRLLDVSLSALRLLCARDESISAHFSSPSHSLPYRQAPRWQEWHGSMANGPQPRRHHLRPVQTQHCAELWR